MFLRKQNMDEYIFWNSFIQVPDFVFYGFDIAPDEGYIYTIPLEAKVYIYVIDASTGGYNFFSYELR